MFRRLLYFGFGFLLSILILSIGPENRLKRVFISYIEYFNINKRVIYHLENSGTILFSQKSECQMKWYSLEEGYILDVLNDGKVNFEKSKKEKEPCQLYVIEKQIKQDYLSVEFEYCRKQETVEIVSFIFNHQEVRCN